MAEVLAFFVRLFVRFHAAIRVRIVATQWRQQSAAPPVSEPARRCIARHKARVAAAIQRNRLGANDARLVRNRSDALIEAYLRGRISTIDDVTVWTLDLANRLGAELQRDQKGSTQPWAV